MSAQRRASGKHTSSEGASGLLFRTSGHRKCPPLPGQALLHVLEENMQPKAGARTGAPAFVVLLTDGKSQDDAAAAASQLKAAGVEIIAVGERGV